MIFVDFSATDNNTDEQASEEDMLGGVFSIKLREREQENFNKSILHQRDSSRGPNNGGVLNETDDLEMLFESIKDCFVTGKWSANENAETLLAADGKYEVKFMK